MGGTFEEYPSGYDKSAYAQTQKVLFTLGYIVLAWMIALRTLDEKPKRQKLNNRHMVILCIFLGSVMRVVYIPVVDSVLDTPDDVKYVFRLVKDALWFTSFALLVAFWIEIQGQAGGSTFVVKQYRPQLIVVILLYYGLRIARAVLEIGGASGDDVLVTKMAGMAYLFVLYCIGGWWAMKLRKKLSVMVKTNVYGKKNDVAKLKASLRDTVVRLTSFMILESLIVWTRSGVSLLQFGLEENGIVSKMETPAAALTIKVTKRVLEFLMIFVLWRMLFVKNPSAASPITRVTRTSSCWRLVAMCLCNTNPEGSHASLETEVGTQSSATSGAGELSSANGSAKPDSLNEARHAEPPSPAPSFTPRPSCPSIDSMAVNDTDSYSGDSAEEPLTSASLAGGALSARSLGSLQMT